ncbi:hypothetical protein [Mucilaginibacter myungsuensis]|uniref:Outer membrane protein with beta-barrel domain n=1 Tax=Mucilaginibacter myungsuensis TaxID=649104 RepID=A0A929KZH8_9SPHI|nr:hypothetical protein [Mucilaginibacter myungsuensis]MBE9663328.1 hypothetical protein [Mucilaginibacter myungsuensis]MDN3600063.1 hypothetical protein [Mucilaginibacter myungsuensis]
MKKITRTLLIFAGVSAIALSADAQKKEFAGTVQVQGMFRPSKLGQLNGILNANSIPSLPENNYWLNLSMNRIYKKFVFEDGIGASFTSTSEANTVNGIKAKYNQFQVFGRFGYDIANNPKMRAFPFVGVNFSQGMLRIRDDNRVQSQPNFSNQLLNQSASKTLWNPRFGLEFGGGFDYLIGVKDKQVDNYTIHRAIPLGVRFGYYLQTSDSNWKTDSNYDLANGPNNKQSAVFVNVNIGLGYKVQRP